MNLKKHILRHAQTTDAGAAGGGDGGAGGAAAGGAAGGAEGAGAGGQAAAGAADAGKGGAQAGAADAGKGGAAGAAGAADAGKAADTKGIWPENWRETVSKDDAKRLAQLQRYGSPEAALQALFAAQDRIRSGELRPALGKNPSAEELKEWREAHGIPPDPTKYELGKDVKIDDSDKPMFDVMMKALHDVNATPEVVKTTVQTWNHIKKVAFEEQAKHDTELQKTSEDALRSEWGTEFRRNLNLVHGLLDGTGSKDLKDNFLSGRLADGTPIGSSPEALKMLLGLALIQNPTGVVVPGGDAAREEGIKTELDKLQKIPANKKTPQQDQRQRDLINAAVNGGFMDAMGNWKK